MRKIHRIDLDFAKDIRAQRKITFKEQDSITLYASIYNDSTPVVVEGLTPRLFVKKSDGTILYQTEVLQVQNNVIAFDVHTQATTCPGLCYAEIELIEPKPDGKDELITTRNFVYIVEPKVGDVASAIKSENQAYFLKQIEDFIKQAQIDIAEYKATVSSLETKVDLANQSLDKFHADLGQANTDLAEAKTQALSEIETKKLSSIEELTTKTTTSLSELDTRKDTHISSLDTKHTEIVDDVALSKTEIDGLITRVTNTAQQAVEDTDEAKAVLNIAITNAYTANRELEATNTTSTSLQEALTNLISLAETTKTDLGTEKAGTDIILASLREVINTANTTKTLIEAENTEANSNILELKPLNLEADLNIDELKALIQEAKDIAIPALKAYIKEHKPAEDLTEVNAQLEELYNAVSELDIRFNNYYTKEEIDKKIGFIDRLGTGLYRPDETEEYLTLPTIDFDPVHTFKLKSNKIYVLFFKVPLTEDKYISLSTGDANGNFVFNNLTYYTDYECYYYYNSEWVKTASINTTSPATKTTRIYYHDFPIYGSTKDTIVFEDTSKTGISDLDKAIVEGKYSIDLTIEDFNNLYNGVKIKGNGKVVGILDVKKAGGNIVQRLDLASHGLTYMRTVGNSWIDISSGAISKNVIGKIKIGGEGLPEEIANIPPLPLYGQAEEDLLIYKETVYKYKVIRFLKGWTGRVYYDGSYIGITAKKVDTYTMYYESNLGKWTVNDDSLLTSTVGTTLVNSAFKVYHNTMPIYKSSSTTNTDLYRDITLLEDGDVLISDLNNAIDTGLYEIDVKTGDNISNLPIGTIQTLDEDFGATYSVITDNMKGMLKVYSIGNTIYQEITTSDKKEYIRTYSDSIWSEWESPSNVVDNKIEIAKSEINKNIEDVNKNIYKTGNSVSYDYALLTKNARTYPELSPIPETTFINVPPNPDPSVYKWWMKCTQYDYHMVFYFPFDPSKMFGVFKDSTGEHFKRLDSTFTYTKYKSYYKAQSTTTTWIAMPSDNHMTQTTRLINAMYEHNFDIIDANNPAEIYYKVDKANIPDAVNDFNDCISYKKYKVNQETGNVLSNSPLDTTFTGILEVEKTDKYIKQVLITNETGTKAYRTYNGTAWSAWNFEAKVEYGEHVMEATVLLNEVDEGQIFDIMPFGTFKDADKYYARISPKQKFSKVTGVTVHSDLADLIIGFELAINVVMINGSNDFFIFIKNNFKDTTGGYTAYEGLEKLTGRALKYSIIGY